MAEQDWIIIGQVVAAQGLKGEVRINPSTDFPERFEVPGQRWLQLPNQDPQSVELERGRQIPGKNLFVVKFEHIQDRTQAENIRGAKVLVRAGDRPELEADEYHVSDLIGLEVFDYNTQAKLGIVSDLYTAAQDVLEVTDANQKKHLVPFVKAIVPVVDLVENRLEVDAPPGLFEI
ncbi:MULTISPECIES: ribosome maturation factor RimM [Cyanophyceae]|uniref:Ribosome maturation factor RimM n=1 Tax=Picosynechococcus sp. (strain ATCC 27264 / PCC 7002 / PR-6) TaxID=32049 RepID=RIMM_PICP2|nr:MULTISPECIES: ribosome maturation factor RimM [Cyanophyceae]B1XKY8.1 RecName: Full=Ribosome maturation factor RimM [Picosynechococcus sp. PCC 7002]ACA99243.1 16S rRNA processing protein RimM [Picosynechococcus sp. PCC 7002]AMA08973.1 ribosome maturation factor RimM [Picosynechococcus sp. PCC 73109]ANV87120.1 ribosome maturation factor RimM [Picosynechococcus sp. PCC 7117]SMH33346.1 16S rRNA processing protein RimM [Picosynechococcus sp. OG1]SMQ84394.1 16S rRNA processing protein RimM [Syne